MEQVKQTAVEWLVEQTAVEWLEEYINKEINKYKIQPMDLHAIYALNHIKEFACSKAKEMEKEQIYEAYQSGGHDAMSNYTHH